MNWLDWFIIAVIVLSAFNGLRKGLILSLAQTFGFLAGLIVAFIYHGQLADYINMEWHLEDRLAPLTIPLLNRWQPIEDMAPFMPVQQLLDQLNIIIAYGIANSVSFLILLAATVVVISVIGNLLDRLLDIKLLKPLNHLSGMLFGLLTGLFLVTALLFIMAPFQQLNLSLAESGNPLWSIFPPGEAFKNSTLVKYFQPLLDMITIKAPIYAPSIENMIPPVDNLPPMEIRPDPIRDITI